MEDFRENVFEFLRDEKTATVSLTQGRYITRIKDLAKNRPSECQIVTENKDGSLVAHIPASWIKINPTRELTEKQLERCREQARKNLHTDYDHAKDTDLDVTDWK